MKGIPISQNVAVTGEISIRGNIKAVGGIYEKIYGAKQAGIKKVIIPFENKDHIPRDVKRIDVLLVKNINEAIEQVFS